MHELVDGLIDTLAAGIPDNRRQFFIWAGILATLVVAILLLK